MIEPTGGVDKAFGVHLNKTYKINDANPVEPAARRDALTISKFSALVERGRACAMALPDVRADRVSQAKSWLDSGKMPDKDDVASSMINSVVEGRL